ncbi:MAG TPA: hypothetical protein VFV47_04930 [Hyphomicrobiaceae bacterium]|nr:hypothetical protein [Hyphomicrobiaceae bacterium]
MSLAISLDSRRPATPAIVSRLSLDHPTTRSFLSDVVIEHGPADILGRLFLQADTALRRKGIRLGFATFEELLDLNRANPDSWRPLLPVFDPNLSGVTTDSGFVVIGRDSAGKAATAHAFRYIPLGARTLKSEIESLRIFYADPERAKGAAEELRVSAPTAASTTGSIVFSGAVWFRPDFRKAGLLTDIQPAVRAMSYTRWGSDLVCSFMAPDVVRGGIAASGRFPHVEWEVTMIDTPVLRDATIHAALVSARASDQLQHFAEYVAAQKKPTAGRAPAAGAIAG